MQMNVFWLFKRTTYCLVFQPNNLIRGRMNSGGGMQRNLINMEQGAINGLNAPANLLKTKLRRGNWLSFGAGLVAMLMLLFALPALHAQTTAQISGTVTDTTGAVIPGASVTLINEATQDARIVKSN